MRYDFEFVKYQGCGNDFILKDELGGATTPDEDRSRLAKLLWDRHFGIGADGILFVERAEGADGSMRLFEPAGNEADMCGNGLRCVAAYLMTRLGKDEVDVLTRDGLKHVVRVGGEYSVDMGLVGTSRKDLADYVSDTGAPSDSMLEFPLTVDGRELHASILNTGEPHIVAATDDLASVNMTQMGEAVNKDHARFPKYVNINFMQITGPHEVKIRTYERGVFGETMACGTGATACGAAALMRGLVQKGPVNVFTRGGRIRIELGPDGRATMTGPACPVFEGKLVVEV
jgi:diaminopimelate epimerase